MDTILTFKNVNAGYGRVRILNDLSFEVKKGEVYGVIGPNGCGKTTMFNALIGLIIPTHGEIIYDGKNVTKMKANDRCRLGIGRTYQVPRPFEGMSVFENCLVAAVHGAGHSEKEDRKRLEIARALGTEPKLLLLDEVAAGLTEAEVKDVMKMVATLKDAGYSIIWIEHVIETMVKSTDTLMCMAQGSNLVVGEPLEVMNSKLVEEVYLGGVEDDE